MKKIFLAILGLFLIVYPSYPHGGEDHGSDESEKIIDSNQENIIRAYYLDNKEILLKYSPFIVNKTSNLDIFITSSDNNKGIILNKIELINKNEKIPLNKNNTDGWYQGHIKLNNTSEYNLKLILNDRELDLGNFKVDTELLPSIDNYSINISLLMILIFLIFLSLFIFFNPKRRINEV
jgi:hypothetical protein